MDELVTDCCVVGGGPAGMMLGLMLARAEVDVVVLEKHQDFLRDFRGDTIHPSTMEVLHELGLLEEFLKLPHQENRTLSARVGVETFRAADFSHLRVQCPFIAVIPQWDFLDFIAAHARRYPNFKLLMSTEATALNGDSGRIAGVEANGATGPLRIRADLTVGADGRSSLMRTQAGLTIKECGAPMDVLWFRLTRRPVDPNEIIGRFGPGSIIVLINRGEYWQCGYVIAKGSLDALRERGLDKFRATLGRLEPLLSDRTDELDDWDAIKLLTVRVDRLRRWYRPGLLCIGDAAHAMSPVGGVGINLAIQDAVATANILAEPLRAHRVTIEHLRMVQERRSLPTFVIQSLQLAVQRGVIARALDDSPTIHPRAPLGLRLIARAPVLQRLNARVIGMGVRAEHVTSSGPDGPVAANCAHRRTPTVDEQGKARATGSLAQTRAVDLLTRAWGVTATILSVFYTAVLVIFAAAVAPLRGGHWVTPIMRFWCWLIFHTCGITGEVEGLEHIAGLDTFVLVSNHQSLIDILAVLYLIPRETRFIAKREIMQVPLIGFAMARSGNIVIDRKTGGHAIRHALAQISQGYSICVFAEGHRHGDDHVHEFSDGAAWLAIATRQMCVPMAISGTLAVMPRGAMFVNPGRHIKLVIGQPISTQDLRGKDRTELTHRLESAVRELFRPIDPAESP